MASLPSANVSVSDQSGSFADSSDTCIVFACCEKNADLKPRVFASAAALMAQHGYSPSADYIALHIEKTGKPVTFIGLPTAVAGVVGRQNASGVTGSSAISVAAGAAGFLEEVSGVLVVTKAGTVGQNGIEFTFSADGGMTNKSVRLKTATSYTPPYLGLVISFAGGTLNVGDRYTFTTTAPKWDGDGIAAARVALAEEQKYGRSWLVIGDVDTDTEAGYVVTAANAYASSDDRFTFARVNVRDRLPFAEMSRTTVRMTGTPTLTFAEVGATGDTITRSSGSWLADGLAVGMFFTVSGSISNNVSDKIAALTDTVMTLGSTDLVGEVGTANCTVVASPALTFAEVGGTGDTITRTGGGSFLADGFRAGDVVTVALSASNNVTGALAAVSSSALTFGTTDLAAEVIGSRSVTIVAGETESAHISAMDDEFSPIDSQIRIDIGIGRARVVSPLTGWDMRRPASWHISIREYEHDVQIPTWRKSDGPLDGVSLEDADGKRAEFDQRAVGGALEAGFSCLRTWANGPNGTFVAMSLTRGDANSLLSRTHNVAVANIMCTVVQQQTENCIGQVLVLKKDGTATEDSLVKLEGRVNSALQIALLQDKGEGPRASLAVWRASRTDKFNVVGAELTGVGSLELDGTVEKVNTSVQVT